MNFTYYDYILLVFLVATYTIIVARRFKKERCPYCKSRQLDKLNTLNARTSHGFSKLLCRNCGLVFFSKKKSK